MASFYLYLTLTISCYKVRSKFGGCVRRENLNTFSKCNRGYETIASSGFTTRKRDLNNKATALCSRGK